MAPPTPPIVQYWHAPEVPHYVAEYIATFRDLNPGRHLLFDETDADAFIARHYTEREVAAFRACAVPAMQADYFRYCAVLVLGGAFSDADHRCVSSLESLFDGLVGGRLFRRADTGALVNGFFAFAQPAHPLLRLVLEIATTNIERRVPGDAWSVTGPALFTGLYGVVELGSIEAFLVQAAREDKWRPVARALQRVVRDRAQVVAAFGSVDIAPIQTVARWLGPPDYPVGYKALSSHWTKWEGSLYRSGVEQE